MFNRRGYSDDEMGMIEPINEVDDYRQGLNVSVKFYLAFTKSRSEALDIMQRQQSFIRNPIQVFHSTGYKANRYPPELTKDDLPRQAIADIVEKQDIYDFNL